MTAPVNDNFAAATVLVGDSGSLTGTTVEATGEVGTVRIPASFGELPLSAQRRILEVLKEAS